ncbi:DinB family protein [Bacillus aquiflavi]|uniref:DinB family protein n=1 Tax=Bacillus aquiflavi TaxID=2672567 RepID=A0A6B3VWQ4_9BACI|nr:DinB family protein [Bacillus aquiflavi]MBA4537423.1 DinB family protein [Bacillus aquiflavi]NEY81678.1 DinB family protein [Bacillus aquiflavi]UAC47979.1 DinB family protein [Bacillus aquiflavi]
MQLQGLSKNEILNTLEKNLLRLEKLVMDHMSEEIFYKTRKNGKWTAKQIIGHLYDTQEVWGKRIAKCCLHNSAVLESYDPELYVRERDYNNVNMKYLLKKYKKSREDMQHLLVDDNWSKTGKHVEEGIFTVKDLAETIALHEIHHIRQVEEIIKS